jgi:gliding motility-associated-like protein
MVAFISRICVVSVIFIPFFLAAQSVSFPIDIHNGQNVITCKGVFTDSGGEKSSYKSNENYSVTFSSQTNTDEASFVGLHFAAFELATGDFMYVYDGEDANAPLLITATGTQLLNQVIRSSGDALHIRFKSTSSSPAGGWEALIACYQQCELFWVNITHNAGTTFDFCPDVQAVTLTGTAGYTGGNPNTPSLEWQWNIEGNIQTGATATLSLDGPGAYPFRVSVTDMTNNCSFDTTLIARVATQPLFTGTQESSDTVCAREQFVLTGNVVPVQWTGFPTSVETTSFLTLNQPFVSGLDFNVFPAASQINSANDFDRICISIEHTDFGHLSIELECPNGTSVLLQDYSLGGAALGEPVIFGNPSIPGRPYTYCFRSNAQFGLMNETSFRYHSYQDMAGDYYNQEPYLPAGSYTPSESLQNLAGCPLNGTWAMRVTDRISGSSGHVMGWSLFFNDRYYPDSLIFTPAIVEQRWFDPSGALLGNGNNPVSVSIPAAGEYAYTFRAVDDFGCSWDTIVVVRVLPLPQATLVSVPELPVCEGDTAVFSVVPQLTGDNATWIYQWMIQGTVMENRIFDTIHAYLQATYTVRITDTVTGCVSLLDLAFSEQNCDLRIPNVFTPNDDRINDFFVIENLEYFPNSVMVIYNRNGKKVFEHNDYYLNWWDGGNQAQGTYYYVLTYTRLGQRRQTQGIITLVR